MNGGGHATASAAPRRAHWRWLRRLLTLAFFVLVPVLLFLLVKNLDWQEVRHTLGEYRPATLFLGLLLAAAGYTVFSSFDLLSRYYIGHSLPKRRVFTVAFVCNAFNLNLSSWVGAVALRYRLYSRLGLDIADITRILTFSLVTNWFGYLLLAGILFSCGLPALPPGWKLGSDGLRLIGALLLALAAGYLLACRFARRRAWGWREHRLTLPSWRLAALQGLLGASNWSLMALLLYSLLPHSVDYPSVLAILLISSIAGVITHIPAGLGVLEAVFIALLQGRLSQGVLLAALIGYRVLYFLLLLAGILFSCGLPALPPGWKLGSDGLRLIGALLLALAAGYLLACRFARRRAWGWREHRLTLPSWRLAALQGLLGASNWSLMALLLYSLLPHSVDYPSVLAILLISSIAGVITHIPAGLGVLEAVFIALLQGRLSQGVLLAALIGYRVLYFLLPLALACVVYLLLERRAIRLRRKQRRLRQGQA
ncbi:UPF0104 family protein [Pseudomonas aeruginosa]|nr:UPF0104 family protein [Pseudomonas aeruginosa]